MMIASETLYSGQITVSVELIKPNYLVLFMSYVLKTKCKPRKKRLPTIFELKNESNIPKCGIFEATSNECKKINVKGHATFVSLSHKWPKTEVSDRLLLMAYTPGKVMG